MLYSDIACVGDNKLVLRLDTTGVDSCVSNTYVSNDSDGCNLINNTYSTSTYVELGSGCYGGIAYYDANYKTIRNDTKLYDIVPECVSPKYSVEGSNVCIDPEYCSLDELWDRGSHTCIPSNDGDPECPIQFVWNSDTDMCWADFDNDGVSDEDEISAGSDPNDGSSTPDNIEGTETDKSKCDTYPTNPDALGWQIVAQSSNFVCITDTLNRYPTVDGSSTFYSKMDSYVCTPKCLGFLSSCVNGKLYSYASRGCVSPDNPENTACVEKPKIVEIYDGVCYDVYYCETTDLYNRRIISSSQVGCTVGSDSNVTQGDTGNQMLDAINNSKVATEAKQDRTNDLLDLENQKLEKIKEKLDTVASKIDTTNTKLDTVASKIDTSNVKLDTIASKIDALNTTTNNLSVNINSTTSAINDASAINSSENASLLEALNGIKDGIDGLNDSNGTGTSTGTGDSNTTGTEDSNGTGLVDLEGALDGYDSILDEFIEFKDNIKSDYENVKTSYENTKSMLDTGIVVPVPTAQTSCNTPLSFRGKTYEFDTCKKVSPYSGFFYNIVYLLGLFSVMVAGSKLFLGMRE
ncbi:MAG: hypothetical protein COB67_08890 [SAR324 cluster bacterium]|uniref:Uncharacterized protein n=1 Tax=SAR324 cluster bacterium TaxID=2024889 RepID=A0A2A4T0T9_9DELT|nr:MAG: hypothetical protein COB67_08890 [SAR324 cluster bacterium]